MTTQKEERKAPEASQGMVVKYKSDELDLTLTENMVKQFLVRGNNALVTRQELVFFMGVCQARGLNPFAGDCYLVKYGQDPAAIITSIDYFRARARKNKDCRGWTKGIIVQKQDGSLRDSAGLILEGEKLVGGWFEATPEGWNVPFRLEVNLAGYIKKTSQGGITKFWSVENQPTMIAKVAESQGLRAVWPRDFGKLYTAEEMGEDEIQPPIIEMGPGGEVLGSVELFMRLAKEKTKGDSKKQAAFFRYVTANAAHYKTTEEQVKIDASLQFEKFFQGFEAWASKPAPQTNGKAGQKAPEAETGKDTGQGDPPSQGQQGSQEEDPRPDTLQISCPSEPGETFALMYCRNLCISKIDCEAWKP
jgi:phage recombination protein Bet